MHHCFNSRIGKGITLLTVQPHFYFSTKKSQSMQGFGIFTCSACCAASFATWSYNVSQTWLYNCQKKQDFQMAYMALSQLGRNYPKNSRKKEMELKVLVCAVRQPAGYANALVSWCTLRKMGEALEKKTSWPIFQRRICISWNRVFFVC